MLKLNQQTVRNWIDQGSLPAVRVGRRVRVRRSDLDRVLEAGSTTNSSREPGGPTAEDFWGGGQVGLAEGEIELANGQPTYADGHARVPEAGSA